LIDGNVLPTKKLGELLEVYTNGAMNDEQTLRAVRFRGDPPAGQVTKLVEQVAGARPRNERFAFSGSSSCSRTRSTVPSRS
jgi:hypothetical protein